MEFVKYQHLEKFGNEEVEGIELGTVHIFPKIDGTNASVWFNGWHQGDCDATMILGAGSRNRELSLEADNAGFMAWTTTQSSYAGDEKLPLEMFFTDHPHLRLFGEWLVPHTFQGYRPEAWKRFYVFDVMNNETGVYLSYNEYQPLMEQYGIEYIPPMCILKNGDYEKFLGFLDKNLFLCPDGGEPGEGIVIKNYDYYNKFGRQCFAKLVRQEFKEQHYRAMGAPEQDGQKMNEELLVDLIVSQALIEKEYAKIVNEVGGWNSKLIPRLLDTIFYVIIKEELWDGLKEIKFGTVNFKTLKALVIRKIKETKKEIF